MSGGSQTTKVQIPAWLETAAQDALSRSQEVSRIPYAPYYGPDVAAMTPMQTAAMQGTNQMASAFGMPAADQTAGMPTATDYNGMSAYSSGSLYDQALSELKARQPGTYNAIMGQFINPYTGAASSGSFTGSATGGAGAGAGTTATAVMRDGRDISPSTGGGYSYSNSTRSMDTLGSYAPGGVNTSNPNSLGNRMAAGLTSGSRPASLAPATSRNPVTRETAGGSGSGKGG